MTPLLPEPTRHPVRELAPGQVHAICAVFDRIWPPAEGPRVARAEAIRAGWVQDGREVFVVWQDAAPVAIAMIFPREILTGGGPLRVMGLAGVCTVPEHRGTGLGGRVVRAAFAEVDRGVFGVALFQTGVPDFYRKLGARRVENRFVNSRFHAGDRGTAENPWWDPHIMVYPAAYPWPEGTIDLLGPGY